MEEELLKKIEELKEKYREEIYIQKKNVPELDDLYYDLISSLAINNPDKAKYYAGRFYQTISLPCKTRINEFLLLHQCSIDLFNSLGICFYDYEIFMDMSSELEERMKKIFQKMISMSKEKTFDLDNYISKSIVYKTVDKLYLLKNDINNIKKITTDYSWMLEDVNTILDYLIKEKYQFSMQDIDFVEYLLNYSDYFDRFVNEAYFDKDIFNKLIKNDKFMNVEKLGVLLQRYPQFANEISLTVNDTDKDNFIKVVSSIDKNRCNALFKIKIQAIDVDFLHKVKNILGENVVVNPQRCSSGDIYYNIDELFEIDQKIEVLAKSLNDSNGKKLSPFEKYISAYIIATNFGIYKEEGNQSWAVSSRSVYEIMRSANNNAIVCVGYVNLLIELLARNGMEEYITRFDVKAKDEGRFNNNDSNYVKNDNNHARLIVYLKDDKYKINGVYMGDPTWDSISKGDVPGKKNFQHLMLTYDEALRDTYQFPNGIMDLKFNESNFRVLSDKFGINVSECFHNPVDTDTIVRALCGVNRFVSKKYSSMPETIDISNTGYTQEEYNKAALQLGSEELFKFDEHLQRLPIDKLIEYLKDEYDLSYTNMSLLFALLFKEKVGKNISVSNNKEHFIIQYEYRFFDEKGNLKYQEEDIEKINNAYNKPFSDFPYFYHDIYEIKPNDTLESLLFMMKNMEDNYDEILEREFNTIISNENMVR